MATPAPTTEHVNEQLEHATGGAETAQGEQHAPEGGLAVLGIDTPFLLAQVVNFLILLALLRWLLYRPLLDMLRKRQETIAAGLKAAEASQAKAAALDRETTEHLAVARQRAKQIVDEARSQAEVIAAEIQATASRDAEALLERTREQLAREKEALMSQAEQELGALVVRATERILANEQLELNADDVAGALREAKGQA